MRRRFVGCLSALVATLLVAAAGAAAQNGTLAGTVLDSDTGEPVSGADVTVLGNAGGTAVTNQAGRFSLSVGGGTHTVVVSMIGYRSHTEDRVGVVAGQTTTLSLTLNSDAFELNPIIVTVGRRRDRLHVEHILG